MRIFAFRNILRVAILGCIFACFSYAGEEVDEILSKLQKKYDSIRDVSVTFVQSVRFGVTGSEQTFSGKMLMKKGNKYRIEMEEQTIVTDGKSVWSFSKINNQVLIDKYKEDPKSFSPDRVVVNVPANYNATTLGKEKVNNTEMTVLKFVPKNEKSLLKWMKAWIDEDDWLMKKIQILDMSDNVTTYSINNITLNPGIADNQFQFVVPSSVEVIDMR